MSGFDANEAMEFLLGKIPRHYLVTVAPANPKPFDEGIELKILLPAETRKQAIRRVARYAPGVITAVQLVKWDKRRPWGPTSVEIGD